MNPITVFLNYVGIGKPTPVVNMFLSKMQNKIKSLKCFLLTEQPLKIMTVEGYTMWKVGLLFNDCHCKPTITFFISYICEISSNGNDWKFETFVS